MEHVFLDRLLYRVDRLLSGNPLGRYLLLGSVALVVVFIVATLRQIVAEWEGDSEFDEGFLTSLWWSIIATLDPVKFADEETILKRSVGVLSSICGLVVVASLIGLVNSSIDERLEQLKKGRSAALVENHVLLLNWERERSLSVLNNIDANAKLKNETRTVVILSKEEKEEVEEEVYRHLPPRMCNLDIIIRTGDPGDVKALEMAAAHRCRTLIVFNPDLGRSSTDAESVVIDMPVIHALLAFGLLPANRKPNIICELSLRSRERLLQHVCSEKLEVIVMNEVLCRLMVQCSRTPKLADIYEDLLSPVGDGVDFYFKNYPELAGLPFKDIQERLYDAVAVGYEADGQVAMNPPKDYIFAKNDKLLVLGNSPNGFRIGPPRKVRAHDLQGKIRKVSVPPECMVLIGYSFRTNFLLREYDEYMAEGSVIYLLSGVPTDQMSLPELSNITIKILEGHPTDDHGINQIPNLETSPSCIVVVSSEDAKSHKDADAATTITVLLLSLAYEGHENRPRVICEIMDASSKDLLDERVGCEFVLSTEVTSRLIAQVAEDRSVAAVYADCFDPDGSEIYLKSPVFYCDLNTPIPWLSVQASATDRDDVLIGYIGSEMMLNPPQDAIVTFRDGDQLIVLSENDSVYVLDSKEEEKK